MAKTVDIVVVPKSSSSVDKINSLILLGATVSRAVVVYTVNLALVTFEILLQVLFGWIRPILIAGFLFSLLSVAILENHQPVLQTADTLKCTNAPFFNTATEITGILAVKTPPIICFWNFYLSLNAIFIRTGLTFFWRCSNLLDVFSDIATVLAKVLESIVFFFLNPETNTSVLTSRFDFASIVTAIQDLIENLHDPLVCACSDLSIYADYLFSVVTDENWSSAVDNTGNFLISLPQKFFQTFFNLFSSDRDIPPDVDNINQVCYAAISFGLVGDGAITNLVKIFWIDFVPTRVVSCISYLICIITDLFYLFASSTITYIWVAAFDAETYNVFTDADLTPLIEHTDELGICLVYTLTPLQLCLGQTVGNLVRFFSSIIRYSRDLVQNSENNLSALKFSLNRFVGQSTYGGGGHILDGHDTVRTQSSLTCLIATALSFGGPFSTCSTAFADLVNSIVQLILLPFVLLTEILDNRELLEDIDGNPLQSSTVDDFEEFFQIIFDAILDSTFSPFDYATHLIQCNIVTYGFGVTLQVVVYNLRNTARDLRDLLIVLIEFVFQLIILTITLLSAPVFDSSTESIEFTIFGRLFVDLFKTLFDLFLNFVENVFNFTIGKSFPALFNQPTLSATSFTELSSPATLPACLDDFGECVCGIFYVNVGVGMCIPLTDVCLADILPSCGIFQTTPTWSTSRKRFTGKLPYSSYFEYLANEFPNGKCGEVFRTFEHYGKNEFGSFKTTQDSYNSTLMYNTPVHSMQGTAFIDCLDRLLASFTLAEKHNWTIPVDYYIREDRFSETSSQMLEGSGIVFWDIIVNSGRMLNFPEYNADFPTNDIPEGIPLFAENVTYEKTFEWYKGTGINDPMALDYLTKGTFLISKGVSEARRVFYHDSRIITARNENPYYKFAETSFKLGTTAASALFMVSREAFGLDVMPYWVSGAVHAMNAIPTLSVDDILPTTRERSHLQKRDHSLNIGGNWFPAGVPTLELNELDDLVIEYSARPLYKSNNILKGSRAVWGKIFGSYLELLLRRDMTAQKLETLTPIRIGKPVYDRSRFYANDPEDIISELGYYHYSNVTKRNMMPHVYALNLSLPQSMLGNEALNFHPDISYMYGMNGMIDFSHHIPNSCVKVRSYCDTNTSIGCDEDLYFQTLGLCNDFVGDFSIVGQCGEDFQAIAIYNEGCEGAPVRIAIATPSNPRSCIRFSINPVGPENDYFCIEFQDCQSCPVRRVIPNLDCEYLDNIFHEDIYLGSRCLALLIGPIFPPFNFSNILPSVTEPLVVDPVGNYVPIPTPTPAPTTTCSSVCGDRIKSNEVDIDGRPCEECDDGNTRNADGCNSRCKREKCPRFRVPSYPVLAPNFGEGACYSGSFGPLTSRRTSRYCWERPLTIFPYEGKARSGDTILSSFQISCIGNNPTVTEYPSFECNGFGVTKTIYKNCTNEASVDLAYVEYGTSVVSAASIRVGKDITCNSKCNLCGDGIKQSPEQCDVNPFLGGACTYCIKTDIICDPNTQACIGLCLPLNGEIATDSRFGVQSPSLCVSFAGITPTITCPSGQSCNWYSAVDVINTAKRDMTHFNHTLLTDVYELMRQDNELESTRIQESRKREIIQLDADYSPQMNTSLTLQAIIPKDDFMQRFAKDVANDVVGLFFGGDSDGRVAQFVDWTQRPGYGTNSLPSERGLLYETVFHAFCDPIKSFNGELGYGLIDGTGLWLLIFGSILIAAGLIGGVTNNTVMLILMLTGLASFLRLTSGTALACYITSTQGYFRIYENIFVDLFEVAKSLNGTCIGVLDDIAITECDPVNCNRTIGDCRSLGYVDGFDAMFGIIEVWLPEPIRLWFRDPDSVGPYEDALRTLSTQSGYDLFGSYEIAKQNFDFNGVIPKGHKTCSILAAASFANIPLLLLVAAFIVIPYARVTIPLLLDIALATWALFSVINQFFLIPGHVATAEYFRSEQQRLLSEKKLKEKV